MHPLGIHKGMTVQLSMTWACLQSQQSAATMTNVLSMHPSIGVRFRRLNMLHHLRMQITIITARSILTCQKAVRSLHHALPHFGLPALNLSQVKQNAIAIPVMLVSIYLLVASVAEVGATCCTCHLIAAFTALNGHATSWALLAIFLHTQNNGKLRQDGGQIQGQVLLAGARLGQQSVLHSNQHTIYSTTERIDRSHTAEMHIAMCLTIPYTSGSVSLSVQSTLTQGVRAICTSLTRTL